MRLGIGYVPLPVGFLRICVVDHERLPMVITLLDDLRFPGTCAQGVEIDMDITMRSQPFLEECGLPTGLYADEHDNLPGLLDVKRKCFHFTFQIAVSESLSSGH